MAIRHNREKIATAMRNALVHSTDAVAADAHAIATGLIGAIRTDARYAGLTDAEKLAEIGEVLAALDIVAKEG